MHASTQLTMLVTFHFNVFVCHILNAPHFMVNVLEKSHSLKKSYPTFHMVFKHSSNYVESHVK